jgi:hypothetical protein
MRGLRAEELANYILDVPIPFIQDEVIMAGLQEME